VLLTAPERNFPPNEAELQLDIASKWGRYTELFGHDDAQQRFFLEDVAVTV
jgi:NitT/TauT family transport system ATP-binding protein